MLLIASRIARSEISRKKKERRERKGEEQEVASETTTRKIRHACERGVS
jgi:hypothetical protein